MEQAIAPTAFRHEFQEFTWTDFTWDIARLIRDIDEGKLRPQRQTLDRDFIENYATTILAQDKNRPRGERRVSLLMAVDLESALALPAAALLEPVICLQTPGKGRGLMWFPGFDTHDHVLADGQHRIAKAYFEDAPSLDMYLLSASQSRKYLKT